MRTPTKQHFLHLFSLLSSSNRSVSKQANKEIIELQNSAHADIWNLSKELLESSDITHSILGSQLLSYKVSQQGSELNLDQKSQIRQYIIECVFRISNSGVLSKLAETFASLSKEQIQFEKWKTYINQIVQFMKLGQRNLIFGLMILSHIPSLLPFSDKTNSLATRQKQMKQIILSSLLLNQSNVLLESLKTLLIWSKSGFRLFEHQDILSIVLNKGFSSQLQTSLQIIEASINFFYNQNKNYPLQKQKVSQQVAQSIEQSISLILCLSIDKNSIELYYPFCQISLSILIKVKWIYQKCYEQLITFAFNILQNSDCRLSVFSISYFMDIRFLNLPNNILLSTWKKVITVIISKCKLKATQDEDINDYRYQSRQLLGIIFQKYSNLNLLQGIQDLLSLIHNCMSSSDDYVKQLGVFIILAIDQQYKDNNNLPVKQQFTKQMIEFCSNSNNSIIQTNCLRYLNLNCGEIITVGFEAVVVNSCIRRLINSTVSKTRQYAMNVLMNLLPNIDSVQTKAILMNPLTELYNNKHVVDQTLLQMYISTYIEFVQTVRDCYPFLTQIITNQLQLAKQLKSMKSLSFVMRSIQSTSTTQLQPVIEIIKQQILVFLTDPQSKLDDKSVKIVYKTVLQLSFPPIQQVDMQILEASIRLFANNSEQNWSLISYLFQIIKVLNIKQTEMQCSILETWLKTHYLLINTLLVQSVQKVNIQSFYQLFFQIQQQLIHYSTELFGTYSQYPLIISYGSQLIQSSKNQILIKQILNFYQTFLSKTTNKNYNTQILKSSLRGLSTMDSNQYFLFYRILYLIIHESNYSQISPIIKSQYLNTINQQLTLDNITLILQMLHKMCSVTTKSSSFKSLLIDLINLKQRTISYEQFLKCLQTQKRRLKL